MREVPPQRRRLVVRSTVEDRDDGPWAVVAVEDAGIGFGKDEAASLFDAFYTTKPGARDGPIDQPLDHRGAWGTAVGDGECGPRRHFPFRSAGNRAVRGLRSRPIKQNSPIGSTPPPPR